MSVFKRGDVYWIDYYYRDEAGRQRRQREAVGPNKKLAEELYRKRLGEIVEHRYFPERSAARKRLREASEEFLTWAKVNVSSSGHRCYALGMTNLIAAFGERYLDEINPSDIEKYKAQRLKTITASSVNRELAGLKRLYNLALKGIILHGVKISESLPRRIGLLRE